MTRVGVFCVAHGTVSRVEELPEFLQVIRRGRPAPSGLVEELTHRYQAIGGSPLNAITARQAEAVGQGLGVPSFWAMRLFKPWVTEVLAEEGPKVDQLVVLPLAPFSVHVYQAAVEEAHARVFGAGGGPRLCQVAPWGDHPGFISWFRRRISQELAKSALRTEVILTAHSLPQRVIAAGDPYEQQVRHAARRLEQELGRPVRLAFQSQGADGGDWLGPDLRSTLEGLGGKAERVVLAPIGFVSEHVETLYDLDIEAESWARGLGLEWARVGTPNDDPEFVKVLVEVARAGLEKG